MNNRAHAERVFFAIALGFFLVGLTLTSAKGHYYWRSNMDPEYTYLFNSLGLLTWDTPLHVDHPGTTLQVFGALVLFVKWVLSSAFGDWRLLPAAVLSQPEGYLHAINLALNLLICLLSFLVARQAYRLTGSWIIALVVQLSFLLHLNIPLAQARVATEPMVVVAGLALILALFPVVFPDPGASWERRRNLAILAGLMFGFGVVSKSTFVVLGTVVLLFAGWRLRMWFLGAATSAGLALTMPAWPRIPRMFSWYWEILTHSGQYGGGEAGLPEGHILKSNLESMLRFEEPAMGLQIVLYIVILAVLCFRKELRNDEQARRTRTLLLCAVASSIVLVAIVAKHHAPHYLLPILVFSALPNAAILHLLKRFPSHRQTRYALVGMGLVLFGVGVLHGLLRVHGWTENMKRQRAEAYELEAIGATLEDCLIIGYSSPSLPSGALRTGNFHSLQNFQDVLSRLYPDTLNYDDAFNRFRNWESSLPYLEMLSLVQRRCVVLQGMPHALPVTGFDLEELAVVGAEAFHRMRAPELPPPVDNPGFGPDVIIQEAESFSNGNVAVAEPGIIRSDHRISFVEYTVTLPAPGRYAVWTRFASEDHRSLKLLINDELHTRSACYGVTGGFDPEHYLWQKAGEWVLPEGAVELRLEGTGSFPHIDQLALAPVAE